MSDLIGNELPNETLVFMDKDKGPQPLKILDFCKGKKNSNLWCTRCIHTNMCSKSFTWLYRECRQN